MPIVINGLFFSPDDTRAWEGFWVTFRSHVLKQSAARAYGRDILKNFNKPRWEKFYKEEIPEDLPLNDMKLASMYVDFYDGAPTRPNKIFIGDQGAVTSLFRIVKGRLDSYGEFHSTIDKSIDFVMAALNSPIKNSSIGGRSIQDLEVEQFRSRARKEDKK